MAVQNIKSSELEGKLDSGLKLVNVFGTWCGPCKMFAPVLDEVSENVEVFKIDIDENREYAQEMQIQGVPTTFVYKDGKLVDQIVGFIPKDHLVRRIEEV